jgi:predicted ATPase/class 3 adenylate cyclase
VVAEGVEVAELPTGTVTFLFTDLESSTRLWEDHPEAMRTALARHDELLTAAVEAHGGVLIKGTGDGLHAVFASANAAAAAALDGQRQLGAEEWTPAIGLLRVRMGLHTGVAEQRGGDYFGPVLNRAARLMSAGHGGQVLCSQATADLLRDSLPESAGLVELGSHRLRDLARPEVVFQLTYPGLPSEFPPLLSLEAYPTNLPAERTALIGREGLLAEVAGAVGSVRVTTLTGVGGVGKTRLARQVAADVLPRYRDGAWLVELAPLVDPAAVIPVVAETLGVTQRTGQTIEATLIDYLRAKPLLLVLDNCEHLLDAVARFIDDALSACPRVHFLATSREGLGVVGERMLAVPSLELPHQDETDVETLAGREAVRLFVERAREAKSGFRLSDGNQAAVVRLCRRLDGIPLAIELAAARVRSLSPAELAERLDARFRLLAGGPRTAVERHQTLRRAIDWSYDLLADMERQALQRLAVFAGGFLLDGAEQVITGEDLELADVVDVLARLVDKSLLGAEDHDGVTRYELLETIRQYAQDRLEASGQADVFHGRHAEYYAGLAGDAGQGLRGPDEVAWTVRVEAEFDNLRAAVAWALATADADLALRLVAPFGPVHTTRVGYAASPWVGPVLAIVDAPAHPAYPEVLAWSGWATMIAGDVDHGVHLAQKALGAAAAASASDQTMCRVLRSALGTYAYAGRADEAGDLSVQFLAVARSVGDDFDLVGALIGSATPSMFAGDNDGARPALDEALVAARRLGNPTVLSMAAMLGAQVRLSTEPDQARELLDEALEAATPVASPVALAVTTGTIAFIHLEQGDWRQASQFFLRALEHSYRIGDSHATRLMLHALAPVLTMAGADETAALFSGTVAVATTHPFESLIDEAIIVLRERLGEDRYTAAVARGASLDDDELVALARSEISRLLADGAPVAAAPGVSRAT